MHQLLFLQAPIQVSRTNSGRVITQAAAGHKWNINITYNPMTRDQFEPVYSFLLEKNGRLNPFFVQLPMHTTSRNSAFTPIKEVTILLLQLQETQEKEIF